MTEISQTGMGAAPQPTQQQEQSVSQKQPQQENQQRFEQKLKEERDKKSSAKESSKDSGKDSGKASGKTMDKPSSLSSVMRQAKHEAQSKGSAEDFTKGSMKGSAEDFTKGSMKGSAEDFTKGSMKGSAEDFTKGSMKGSAEDFTKGSMKGSAEDSTKSLLEEKSKTPSEKADAILQGLQPSSAQPASTEGLAVQETQQTHATAESSNRLLEEFQKVADRVMHTSQSLQQGGSVRLRLGGNVLPGTSVTFSMVAGALHVTFSSNNKKSLAKLREHEASLVAHVRKQSGVDIVVATQDEQESDQQQGGSL